MACLGNHFTWRATANSALGWVGQLSLVGFGAEGKRKTTTVEAVGSGSSRLTAVGQLVAVTCGR